MFLAMGAYIAPFTVSCHGGHQ